MTSVGRLMVVMMAAPSPIRFGGRRLTPGTAFALHATPLRRPSLWSFGVMPPAPFGVSLLPAAISWRPASLQAARPLHPVAQGTSSAPFIRGHHHHHRGSRGSLRPPHLSPSPLRHPSFVHICKLLGSHIWMHICIYAFGFAHPNSGLYILWVMVSVTLW